MIMRHSAPDPSGLRPIKIFRDPDSEERVYFPVIGEEIIGKLLIVNRTDTINSYQFYPNEYAKARGLQDRTTPGWWQMEDYLVSNWRFDAERNPMHEKLTYTIRKAYEALREAERRVHATHTVATSMTGVDEEDRTEIGSETKSMSRSLRMMSNELGQYLDIEPRDLPSK